MAKKSKVTVKKQIELPEDLSLAVKTEVIYQRRCNNRIDEKQVCVELISDGLQFRHQKRK